MLALSREQATVILLGMHWINQSQFGFILLHFVEIILGDVATYSTGMYIPTTALKRACIFQMVFVKDD